MKDINITFWGRVSLTAFVVLTGIYVLTGYAAAAVCSDNDGKTFSFIVFGDSRGAHYGVSPILKKLIQSMTEHVEGDKPAPSFAVFLGDAAYHGGRDNLKEWEEITSALTTKIPVLFVKGNHDIYGKLNGYSYDGEFQEFQRERLDSGVTINSLCVQRPQGDGYSGFSFMWNGSLFIILDTYDMQMPNGQRNGWISPRQMKMLASALNSNTAARHKFVFTHTPAFDNGIHGNITQPQYLGSWSHSFMDMWKIIDKHRVDIVFSAHNHYYARKKIDSTVAPEWKNGVLQVITGGAGAPLYDPESCVGGICFKYDTPPNIGKTYHFIIVTVAANGLSYKVYDLDNKLVEEYVISTVERERGGTMR
ncbi:MAG: metallophosphoesterase [Nitrospirota bacterium]